MAPLLEARSLTKYFGGLVANDRISLTVEEGEIVGLIGPNGAGKTTFFAALSGFVRPDSGRVLFAGKDITGWPPDRICRQGLVRTFQVVRPFSELTVFENVMVGSFSRVYRTSAARAKAQEVLEITGLWEKRFLLASSLTIADKKRLELARALATSPRLMMLDEVMAGLTPKETQGAVELIRRLHQSGITFLVIEHVMEVVMPISDRVIVLDGGKKIAEGRPKDVVMVPEVIKAYLGEKFYAARGK